MELWKNSKYLNSFGLVVLLKESGSEFQYLAAAYLSGLRQYVLVVLDFGKTNTFVPRGISAESFSFLGGGMPTYQKARLGVRDFNRSSLLLTCASRVVYHLHGQTIRFMVWANVSKSSERVNVVPEWRLPLVKICSIFRKNGCEGLKLVSKMILKERNKNFRLDYSLLLPKILSWEDPKSRFPFAFQPDVPEKFCKW